MTDTLGNSATDLLARTLPPDPNVAQRQASDPTASVWVGASAGSGKTKVLTDRVLRLMLAGTPPARILCLTFTKAAAAEMAIRINRTLGLWATLPDDGLEDRLADLCGERPSVEARLNARRLFAQVVDCPGGMKIQTIHAFCQSLLRRFPLEAELAPHFDVMDDRTADGLLTEARDAVLHAGRTEPDRPLGRAMARLTADLNAEDFAGLLAELAGQRGQIEKLLESHGGLDGLVDAIHDTLNVPPGVTEESILAHACHDDRCDPPALREACRALSGGSAGDQERGIAIQQWLDAADRRVRAFEAYKRLFLTAEGSPRKTLITKKPATACPQALAALQKEAERLVEIAERVKAAGVAASTTALLTLAQAMLEAYRERKAARALLDYDDLILAANRLLGGKDGTAARVPWVLYKLDGGLDHILIDEAQDTNPDQWAIVAALAGEFFAELEAAAPDGKIRTVFAVGDEKQSIFSFQRADPAEFARMRCHFQDKAETAERLWSGVDLDISFRSTSAVLETVDAVFAIDRARDGVASDASPVIRHRAFRRGQAGLVELWPPVKPAEVVETTAWAPPVAREATDSPSARLASVIAATVHRWIDSGERLEAKGRPVQPGDVMVLVRRRTAFVTELVRALKDRGVPVAGVDRMVLTEQLAVMDLVALADFLLLPDDDLTLATVLKGPLIGLTEEELFRVAHGRRGTLWRALVALAETEPDFRPARRYLGDLLARTDFSAPYELFAGLLNRPCPADTRSGRRAILKRLGPDAQDPLEEFLAVCLAFEKTEPPSLQNFLAWLAASDAEIKRELEQGGGTVRIMTVHGSKGLQAPIVFLPDTLGSPDPEPADPVAGRVLPGAAVRRTAQPGGRAERRGADAGQPATRPGIPPAALCRTDAGRGPALHLRPPGQARAVRRLLVPAGRGGDARERRAASLRLHRTVPGRLGRRRLAAGRRPDRRGAAPCRERGQHHRGPATALDRRAGAGRAGTVAPPHPVAPRWRGAGGALPRSVPTTASASAAVCWFTGCCRPCPLWPRRRGRPPAAASSPGRRTS